MKRNRKRPARSLFVLAILAAAMGLVAAGCGGGGSSSSGSTSGGGGGETATTAGGGGGGGEAVENALAAAGYVGEGETGLGIRPSTGPAKAKAEKAGEEAGAEQKAAEVPEEKIGIISYLNGIESSDRLVDTATFAAAQLGWKTTVCDGKGTPTQFVACGNSLLAEGVNAIVDVAIEPSLIAPVLKEAKSKGVPVVQAAGGTIPAGELSGSYGPSEEKSGELLANAMIEELESVGGGEVAIHNFPAAWGKDRTSELEKALEGNSDIKVADNVQTDATNLVGFTRNTVSTELTQNPDLKAFWFAFDAAGQVGGQTVASKFSGKKFPEKPLVATFHGDLATIALMHQGAINMIGEVNYDAGMWVAVDQLADYFGREAEISTEADPRYPVIGDPYTYQVITEESMPEEGEYAEPKWDIPSYFISKWRTEYGL